MIYTQRLLANSHYLDLIQRISEAEKERSTCRHDLRHYMDVARIARILNNEKGLGLDTDDIYLSVLLHDLGRLDEYEKGISHDKAGTSIAAVLLEKIEYPEPLRSAILDAISGHRVKQ